MKFFRDRCTAGLRAAFEHQRLKSRFGQVKGGYQPVVPATNDDDITSLRHLGRRPPKIFENFERREPSGSAHDSAARMGRRSARSEERRVGKECRSRWWECRGKQKRQRAKEAGDKCRTE